MQNNFENLYVSGKRIGPTNCKFNVNKERDLLFADREKETFLWSFLQFSYSPNQFIPSLTGYNITIIDGTLVLKSSIQYLDCTLKNFMAPFCGWGSTASRLEPLRGGSLPFTTKFPRIPGTHFIDLRRMKG